MSNDLHEQINATIEQLRQDVEQRLPVWSKMDSPAALRQMKLEMDSITRVVADGVTSAVLKHRLADSAFQAQTSVSARSAGRYRSGGRRFRTVRLLGGSKVRVGLAQA